MAVMTPDSLGSSTSATPGERWMFRFFQTCFPDDFRVWFERVFRSRGETFRPDFLLLADSYGLLVIEVKDWNLDQFVEADFDTVLLESGGKRESKTHPYKQVRRYGHGIESRLKEEPLLVRSDGKHAGKLCMPWGCGVVLFNIRSDELYASEFGQFFPHEWAICRDELEQLQENRSDREVLLRFRKLFPHKWYFNSLSEQQVVAIDSAVSPAAACAKTDNPQPLPRTAEKVAPRDTAPTVEMKRKASPTATTKTARGDFEPATKTQRETGEAAPVGGVYSIMTSDQLETAIGAIKPENVVRKEPARVQSLPEDWGTAPANASVLRVLTGQQEQYAKSIGSGHRIFYGSVGSGKTVILVARAKYLAEIDPTQRITVLCYNVALAAELKSKLEDHRNVTVSTVVSFLISKFKIVLEPGENHDQQIADQMAALPDVEGPQQGGCIRQNDQSSVILVDEGHDLMPEWFRGISHCVRKDGDLVIALDGTQALYRRSRRFTWKGVCVNARGRAQTIPLTVNHRNTRRILEYAWCLTQDLEEQQQDDENDVLRRIRPDFATARADGYEPIFWLCDSISEEIEKVVESIQMLTARGVREEDIAILYGGAYGAPISHGADETPIGILVSRIRARHSVCVVTESKRSFPKMPGIRVSTIHSAKGLEFHAVIVVGVDKLKTQGKAADPNQDRNLLYVGMTRAMEHLILTCVGDCEYSERFATMTLPES